MSEPRYDITVPPEDAEFVLARCAGCQRRVHVRVFNEAREFWRNLAAQGTVIPDNMSVAVYECGRCHRFTVLTARALRMIPGT